VATSTTAASAEAAKHRKTAHDAPETQTLSLSDPAMQMHGKRMYVSDEFTDWTLRERRDHESEGASRSRGGQWTGGRAAAPPSPARPRPDTDPDATSTPNRRVLPLLRRAQALRRGATGHRLPAYRPPACLLRSLPQASAAPAFFLQTRRVVLVTMFSLFIFFTKLYRHL
jgi:hypothetical protein